MNILHIDSCALGDHSVSRQLTANAAAALAEIDHTARVIYRDLAAAPLSHVSGPLMQAMLGQWDKNIPMSAELRAEVLQSESLLQEFLDADVLVLGAPLCNFSIPSTLKVWLDRLLLGCAPVASNARLPFELVRDKRVLLVSAPSHDVGEHPGTMQTLENNLNMVFKHIGISVVETFHSEQSLPAQLNALLAQEPAKDDTRRAA